MNFFELLQFLFQHRQPVYVPDFSALPDVAEPQNFVELIGHQAHHNDPL